MIFRRAASPSSLLQPPISPSPEATPCPSIFSAPSTCSWDDDAMSVSTEYKGRSRPVSLAPSRVPSLSEILQNRSAPPYTLSAFTAYLSQKQCLENLEFVVDARNYAQRYDELSAEMTGIPMTEDIDDCKDLAESWLRILTAYIVAGSPKEVNLPDHIRRELLKLHPDRRGSTAAPPAPELLERAVDHIIQLMDESIMMGFVSETAPKAVLHQHSSSNEFGITGLESDDERRLRGSRLNVAEQDRQRSRSRRNYSPELQSGESSKLQTQFPSSTSNQSVTSVGPGLGPSASRGSVGSASVSGDVTMVDEASAPSSPSDLMTPPTTPPGADVGGSPRQAQNPWRKMMDKFGNKKRSSSRMER